MFLFFFYLCVFGGERKLENPKKNKKKEINKPPKLGEEHPRRAEKERDGEERNTTPYKQASKPLPWWEKNEKEKKKKKEGEEGEKER